MKLQEAKTTSGNKCVTQGKTQTIIPCFTHKKHCISFDFSLGSNLLDFEAKFRVWWLEL